MRKIIVDTQDFKNILEKVIKVTPKKSSVKILEELCFTVNENGVLSITAADLDTYITGFLKYDCTDKVTESNNYIIEDSKSLVKALKYFKEYATTLITHKDFIEITNGNKSTKLKLIDADYPETRALNKDKLETYSYDAKKLSERIKAVEYATAKDSTRPLLEGIHFNNNDIVALDGFRMALNIDNNLYINNSFTLLKTGLKHLAATFKDSENITINEYEKVVTFENEETLIILKKIEGNYFDYPQLFNEKAEYAIKTDNKQIQEGFSYLKTFNKENKPTVRFTGNTMTLNNTDISFTIDNIESYNDTIGFNCDYMLDALKQIDEDTVTINMASSVNPIIIQNEEGNNKALILPIRLK